jgi:predicted transcriptional regulator
LWIAHEAVAIPDRIHLQVAEMPEGRRFVFLPRGWSNPRTPISARRAAMRWCCEVTLASEFIYADTLNLECEEAVARIGISCRICSRHDCHQRAYPPNDKAIDITTNQRGFIPYRILD